MNALRANRVFWLRGLCALALLLAAFAHQPLTRAGPPGAVPPDLAAYVLPDGTLPVLCLSGYGDESNGYSRDGACEFCRVAGSVLPPPQTCLPVPPDRTTVAKLSISSERLPTETAFRPGAPPRGPPSA